MHEFDDLIQIMARLRAECPWDKEQDLSTLRKYLLEECYECLDALENYIQSENPNTLTHLKEELGDVLLQILFQSKILHEKTGQDCLKELMIELKDKLVRRHPHIFEKTIEGATADSVLHQWNQIKAAEKPKEASLLGKVPEHFSALMRSHKLGDKAKKAQFDWPTATDVWKQIESEWTELKAAQSQSEIEDELGDVFFSLAQWARHKGIDSEVALAKMNRRFESRFHEMEKICREESKSFTDLSLDEKEKLWQRAKSNLKT